MLNPKKAIAIDIGGTFIKSGLVDKDGNILKKSQINTPQTSSLAILGQELEKALYNVWEKNIEVAGLGIGTPGCVDSQSTIVHSVDNIPALNGQALKDYFPKEIPLFVDNDANQATKGEYLFGLAKGCKNILVITLGTGVGGGLILNGSYYRGYQNYAGEIGHTNYIPDGLLCSCGKKGCLEAYASATAITQSAKRALKIGISSTLQNYKKKDIDAKLLCELAKNGDALCQNILTEAGKALGISIANMINLLNLEKVIISGGLALAGELLLNPLQFYAQSHSIALSFSSCQIAMSTLGNDANLLGCGASVFMKQ